MATANVVELQKNEDAVAGLKLELVRVIKANRRRVFDAWTRPETIRQWFGRPARMVAEVAADAQVGGAYRIAMKAADSPETPPGVVSGRYTRVDPYDALAFTWRGDWNPTEESQVTITLRDVEGGTEMTLIQERFLTEQSRDAHRSGWNGPLVQLQEVLESA